MGKRERNTPVEDEDDRSLAIYNRSRRTITPAQDFLVENAELYDVTRLYGRKGIRTESPDPTLPSLEHEPQGPNKPGTPPATPPPRTRRNEEPQVSTPPPPTEAPALMGVSRPVAPPANESPADDNTMLDLFITTLSGRQANIRILAGRSVNELAARMETLIGLPLQQIRFKCNGVDLPNGPQSLRSLGVRSGDEVVIRLDGTAPGSGGQSPSPFKQRVTLFGNTTPSKRSVPPSPFKELPLWLRQ